jgi:DNA repair exonuclease SbcCD ATPase subunit
MSEKEAGQVLTSENAAEFYANRLGLAESPAEVVAEKSEPTEVVEQSEPEEAEAEAKQEGERKQNPKLERRFSEITKQREEARKEAQQEREARQALEQRLAALENQKQPAKVAAIDEKPQPSQFSDAFEYAEALAEYTADKRIAEMKQQEAQAKEAEERQKVIKTWAKKVETAKASMPDFDEIVASSDVVVNDDIRDAILESDVGPQILYHLAENDEIAKKIAGLSPKAALREIGKLEARFEVKPEAEKTAPIVKSKAPTPIQPIRGGKGSPDVQLDSSGNWYGSFEAYKAARKAGKIR